MPFFRTQTAALLMAGIALTASPAFAQRHNRHDGGDGGRREGAERSERSDEFRGRFQSRERAVPRGDVAPYRFDNRAYRPRDYDNRYYYGNRPYAYRYYGYRPYYYQQYYYRPVFPYGWRPYGYRPGWSLNLYFGRPYGVYGYPSAGYGYYGFAPGRAYGSVRIVDAPRDARVLVDGYYAGIVDDYDGVFQHLNLEVGSHHIAIELDGYPPVEFDVYIRPGETITYHANLY